jgi:hypothetical protein
MDIQNSLGMVAQMGLYESCEKLRCKYLCCICTLGFRQYSRKLLLVSYCEVLVTLSQLYCLPSLMMFIIERHRFENEVFQKVALCEGCTVLLSF